jgi:hypothetical protein
MSRAKYRRLYAHACMSWYVYVDSPLQSWSWGARLKANAQAAVGGMSKGGCQLLAQPLLAEGSST